MVTTRKHTVGIVDDHGIVRWAIRELLEDAGKFEVIGEAADGTQAVALVQAHQPELLILDLSMPEMDGIAVLEALRRLQIPTQVVVLTMHTDPAYGATALRGGARAFVHKSSAPELLITTLDRVLAGEQVASPEVLARLSSKHVPALTPREFEIMHDLARGARNREIADRLGLSIKTVDTHRMHILKKLGLRNNAELTRYAVEHGYLATERS